MLLIEAHEIDGVLAAACETLAIPLSFGIASAFSFADARHRAVDGVQPLFVPGPVAVGRALVGQRARSPARPVPDDDVGWPRLPVGFGLRSVAVGGELRLSAAPDQDEATFILLILLGYSGWEGIPSR